MWDRFFHRATRLDVVVSLCGAFGLGTAVSWFWSWIAGKAELVAAQGWAAVALVAGLLGSLTVIALGLAALALLAWRGRPAGAAPTKFATHERLADVLDMLEAAKAAGDSTSELLSAQGSTIDTLSKHLGSHDAALRDLRQAMADLAEAQKATARDLSGAATGLRQAIVDAAGENNRAIAGLEQRIADVEMAAKTRSDQAHALFERLFDGLRERQDGLEAALGESERGVRRRLRARDDLRALEGMAADIAARFGRLSRADPQSYAGAAEWRVVSQLEFPATKPQPISEACGSGLRPRIPNWDTTEWRADHDEWQRLVGEFCRALARWDPNGVAPNPFALKHRDIQAVTPPESELLSGFDNALC
jgi:hypothetical protein